ncbi:MAG: hypothetical protein WCC45_12320, partial [Paeniglutamicibacter sp.]
MATNYTRLIESGRLFTNILVATVFGLKHGNAPEPCGSGANPERNFSLAAVTALHLFLFGSMPQYIARHAGPDGIGYS